MEAQAPRTPTIRTVIIEDQVMICQLLALGLGESPPFVVAGQAHTAAAGLALCLQQKPDLVVVDIHLPDQEGSELIRTVRQSLPKARFLGISADFDRTTNARLADAGCHGFVVKTSSVESLREAALIVAQGGLHFPPSPPAGNHQEDEEALASLSRRELEVLRMLVQGHTPKGAAAEMNLSSKTVSNHYTRIQKKLRIFGMAGLVHFALRHGLVKPN